MTRRDIAPALLCVLALAGCRTPATPPDTTEGPTAAAETPPPDDAPPTRLDAGTEWARLPDFDALRREYGERADFSERCEQRNDVQQAVDLYESSSWQSLRELADDVLARCPVDIDFHLLAAVALEKLGLSSEAVPHLDWRRGLIESILRSGDGRTAETAWVVISIPEEYAFLRALGADPVDQSLVDGSIDAISVAWQGEVVTVFFDPAAHFRRLERIPAP